MGPPWHSSLALNPRGRAGGCPRLGHTCSAAGPGGLCPCTHGAHTRLLSEVIRGFSLSEESGSPVFLPLFPTTLSTVGEVK